MQAKLGIRLIKSIQPQAKPVEIVDSDLKGFLLRVQPSGIMTYYFSYRNTAGKRKRYRIGNHQHLSPAQARDIAENIAAKVASGEDAQANKKQHKLEEEQSQLKTLGSFLENKYAPWVLTQRKNGQGTLKRIKFNFAKFMSYPMDEISPSLLEGWRNEAIKSGKKPVSINRDLMALKAMLSKAIEWDVVNLHPLAKLKPLKVDQQGKIRYLLEAEEKRLRDALDEREKQIRLERTSANEWRQKRNYPLYSPFAETDYVDHLKPIVLLAINTGMRRGEIFNLTWENIDFDNTIVTVEGAIAKSGKTRHIPLNVEAIQVLKTWKNQGSSTGLLFPGKDKAQLNNIKKAWCNLLTRAEIKAFRFHDLRHHFASRLVMAGVDLNTVRELLGHSDIKMTLRYAHLAPEHKAAAVAKLVRVSN